MQNERYPFKLPPLPYAHDALEPYIDAETMHYHHDKHFKAYIDNLNKALEPYPEAHGLTLAGLLSPGRLEQPGSPPEEARRGILDNAGGVYNHDLFFKCLSPRPDAPGDQLTALINSQYGSFEAFKKAFSELAASVFGSGWACLAIDGGGRLSAVKLANQDTVVPAGMSPVMLFDVWEHAYYLKYKNLRADYIDAIWNVASFPMLRART
ncbi:MAG: superoxide dismutase [Oscillospiraceae bacterium]|nr:superoxide dismutase [Oscillospiraceae bacterium]